MSTGAVKFFNSEKGYGFIVQDSGEKDLFVHCSEIQDYERDSINDGQKVQYEVGEGRQGPCAVDVVLAN